MHELFAQHAARAPEAPALTFEGTTVSYGELNRRANQLARRLTELGAGRETLVALFLEPSVEMIVSILGVLKAGAAYVPLDPEYPSDRIAFVLEDAAAPLVVTQEGLVSKLPSTASAVKAVCLDRDAGALEALSGDDPAPVATPENLAYVIYTSGSTGRPKGVLVEHRNVARLFTATDEWYEFRSVRRVGAAALLRLRLQRLGDLGRARLRRASRDLAAVDDALAGGARRARRRRGRHRPQRDAEPVRHRPGGSDPRDRARRPALRYVVFGGEALAPAALRPWYERYGEDGATLVNMYGITETTVHVTYRPLTAADCDRETSPIGVPIPDLSLHMLDPHGAARSGRRRRRALRGRGRRRPRAT